MSGDETIVAVATAGGRSAHAVLRVSGTAAFSVLARLFAPAEGVPPFDLGGTPGFSRLEARIVVAAATVRASVDVYRAPRSYTGEDLFELTIPGSPPLVEAAVRAISAAPGCRLAGPGEFTLRAFLSGRIGLDRAEAVERYISAHDAEEARAARRSLDGELGRIVRGFRGRLLEARALLEADLDFVEDDIPDGSADGVAALLDGLASDLAALRASTSLRLAPRGVRVVVIAGLPNAGKSTLFNRLVESDRALVSPRAGTTRDPVRARGRAGRFDVEWVDLAGLEEASLDAPAVELESSLDRESLVALRRMTRTELDRADLVVWVIDAAAEDAGKSFALSEDLAPSAILVANKIDRVVPGGGEWRGAAARVAAITGEGILALRERIEARLLATSEDEASDATYLVTVHQETQLERTAEAVEGAREALRLGVGGEFVAADLHRAARCLGAIVGEMASDEILGHIFARFCIGK